MLWTVHLSHRVGQWLGDQKSPWWSGSYTWRFCLIIVTLNNVFSLVQNWSSDPWTPTAYIWDGLVWLGAAQGVLMSRAPTCIGRTNHAQTNHRCMEGFPLKSAEELTTYQMMNGQERKQLPIEQATSWLPNKGSGNVELICGLICPSGRANAPSLLGRTYTSLPGVPYNLPAIKSRWWAHHSMSW